MKENIYKETYNEQCKSILGFKYVIAQIMKNCIDEYKDCDLDTIMNELIEKDHDSNGEKIIGITNDFDDVRMDLFFSAGLPNSDDSIGMLINLEPQKTTHVGYKINNRALLYSGYELVFQHGRNVTNKQYDNLKKVVSIWICFDAPTKQEENSITYFHLTKDIEIGYNVIEPKDYDKLQIVIIYMGQYSSDHKLLRFLELLFTNQMSTDEKIELLKEQYDLKTSKQFRQEVDDMCGLADRIEEQGIRIGLEKGREEGREEGEILGLLSAIKALMETTNTSLIEAMKMIKIKEEDYHIFEELLSK